MFLGKFRRTGRCKNDHKVRVCGRMAHGTALGCISRRISLYISNVHIGSHTPRHTVYTVQSIFDCTYHEYTVSRKLSCMAYNHSDKDSLFNLLKKIKN